MPRSSRSAGSGGDAALHAAHRAGAGAGRVVRVWRGLPHERRLAAGAALALFVTLFLPWYQETVIATSKAANLHSLSASVTGWGAFSFVEAAVLLVAVGVLVLLFQRAEGRAFHLPGGDGWVIMLAGGWACVLVVWRIFDKQGTTNSHQYATTWGIEWGIFAALAVAAFLAYAGSRIRAAHRPEPPLPGESAHGAAPGDGPPGPEQPESPPSARRRRTPAPVRAGAGAREEAVPGRREQPPAAERSPEPAPAAAPRRAGERPAGWLTGPPADAHERAAPPPPDKAAKRSWSYREDVGEDAPVSGEWDVADFDYSRERSRPSGTPPLPDSPPGPAGSEDETVADPPPPGRRRAADEQLTIRLEPEDGPS